MSVKIIEGFGGFYCVSDDGKIWSRYNRGNHLNKRKRGRWRRMALYQSPSGHLVINLSFNGNSFLNKVHRLVLETFVGPCPEGMECRHLDGDPSNNNLDNLKWGTRRENQIDRERHDTDNKGERNGNAILTSKIVIECRIRAKNGEFVMDLSEEFDVKYHTLLDAVVGRRWKWIKEVPVKLSRNGWKRQYE